MVGNPVPRGGEDAVSNALMSLLRENGNGHWDETDLKMRPDGSAVDLKGEELEDWNKEQERNDVVCSLISPYVDDADGQLANFISPIGKSTFHFRIQYEWESDD